MMFRTTLIVSAFLLLPACSAKYSTLPPPPERPAILVDDPKTCCDDPSTKPKAISDVGNPDAPLPAD